MPYVISLDYLAKLFPIMREHGCSHLKMEGLELSIGMLETSPKVAQVPPLASMPHTPDLRADDLMSYDTVLNWSGSPSDDQMPLAPEQLVAP